MASCSTETLLASANEFHGLTSGQLQLVITQLLCRILRASNPVASCSPEDLLRNAECLVCLTAHQLMMIQTQLLCEILTTGGGTGAAVCLLCGTEDPVEAAVCDCSIYYRTDTSQFWFWDPDLNQWVIFIA